MTPLRKVEQVTPGNYAVQTQCGYRLRVRRDTYNGGWRIWQSDLLSEWSQRTFPTKRAALAAIIEHFSQD